MMRRLSYLFASVLTALPLAAQSRDPVVSDPVVRDRAHPPAMDELAFESGGSRINGFIYLAQGAEPHPTVVLLHGYPGNERNLDLAQAMRRAGMNVLFFDYRGSWGSGGEFSFANAQEDVATAVRWLRSPELVQRYHIDPARIALVGHSMGAWLALLGAAADSGVRCAGAIELADMARRMKSARADSTALKERMGYDDWLTQPGGPLHADARALEASLDANAERWDLTTRGKELAGHTLLLLDNDHNTDHAVLVRALGAAGARHLTAEVWTTDHSFSDRRIALARRVVGWLDRCQGPGAGRKGMR
ncbi:MAG: alpha/beta fold hydrolase [Gemmatimonadaceae bacterium]|nr:alpha/beta fold hydrolase [Gemmatimonadaceae bacterium]NUQ93088.1 alpha/beta fold hydrolase [Gemmatimonadaceae bacterium]NUR18480.1 alpha/beta fold hydrolase [Gemmatimonadaceae bacterium]NUS95929.1 alpha/beta fold hydrolase [Gemmatimonadaceae bacterium]